MIDYLEVKRHFAEVLANDADGIGRFEAAFYKTMKMVYMKGVDDGAFSTAPYAPKSIIGIIDHGDEQ